MLEVLVVDDEPSLLEISKAFLEKRKNIRVHTATSGKDALVLVETTGFDALVSDYMMPGMDGLELLKALRAAGNDVPFILFTGRGREDVAIEALNLGADFYLQKGGDPKTHFAELTNLINQAVARKHADDEVRRLADIVETSGLAIASVAPDGTVLTMNKASERLYGHSFEDLKGRQVTDMGEIVETPPDKYKEILGRVLKGEHVTIKEAPRVRRNGERFYATVHLSPVTDSSGRVRTISVASIDVTAEKLAKETIERRLVIEDMLNSIAGEALSASSKQRFLESTLERIGSTLGLSRAYVYRYSGDGTTVSCISEWDPTRPRRSARDLKDIPLEQSRWWISRLQKGDIIRYDDVSRIPDKEVRDRTISMGKRSMLVVPLVLSSGTVMGFIGLDGMTRTRNWSEEDTNLLKSVAHIVSANIERREAQENLGRSEGKYRSVVQSAPCLICKLSPDGTTLFVNEHIRRITGYEPDELINHNWWDILYPGELRGQVGELMSMFSKGDVTDFEMVMKAKSGENRTVLWNSFNAWDGDHASVLELNGAGIDITRRRAAEDGLRESGAFNRAVLDALDAIVAVLDRKGRIVAVNTAWEKFGKANSPQDAAAIGVGADYLQTCRDSAARKAEDAGQILAGIESVLHGRERSFSYEYPCHSPDDERWFVLQVTPLSKKRGGAVVSHIEVTGRKRMERALKENEERYRAMFETTGAATVVVDERNYFTLVNSQFETISGHHRKELVGKKKWVEFIHPDDLKRLMNYHEARMRDPSSAPMAYDVRGIDKDGHVHRLAASVTLLTGTKDTLVSMLDVTETKRQEEALDQANKKLSLLSTLTRHDILNQLSVMYGHIELLRTDEQDPAKKERMEKALASGDIIRRHLEFSRDYQSMGTVRPDWTDVHPMVEEAFASLVPKSMKVTNDTKGLRVFADPMIKKVLYNLVDNTMRHSGGAHSIRISYQKKGDQMVLAYEDDGKGIPEEDKDRIFERETGFGLYLAREVLGITGITIKECGVPGKGARFEMIIPVGAHREAGKTR